MHGSIFIQTLRTSLAASPQDMKRRRDADIAQSRDQAMKRRRYRRATGMNPTTMFGPAVRRPSVAYPELKGVDVTVGVNMVPTVMDTSSAITLLNGVAPGTGSYNRVGRHAQLKSIRISGYWVWSKAADINIEPGWLRQVIVWDSQPSGTLPKKSDIFGMTSQDGTEASFMTNGVRYDNTARFKILKDNVFTFNVQSLATTAGVVLQQVMPYDIFIDLKEKKTTYSGQNTPCTIADISSGALYVIRMSSLDVDQGGSLVGTGYARLRYTD